MTHDLPHSTSMSKTDSIHPSGRAPRHGVARAISKLGIASRMQAAQWVREGRVTVNGKRIVDPEFPVRQGEDLIRIEGERSHAAERVVVVLNKPKGLLTTTRDEKGRDTVYRCFEGADLPWMAPVGRLDKASEGLLLFCNDPEWAAGLTDPEHGVDKHYHVQIDRVPESELLAALERGIVADGLSLSAKSARLLRHGQRNAWIEIVLDEGKNRQIRRLLQAFDIAVLRLVRVAIGSLVLGDLPKGHWRVLGSAEVEALVSAFHQDG